MAHYVHCVFCNERFDRDKVPCVAISQRRYAHTDCATAAEAGKSKEEHDYDELVAYIKKLFDITQLSPKINKQIQVYHDENNFSYSGIHKSLVYFYEVKGNSIAKANGGIGIVPYVYDMAKQYYTAIWIANQQNKEKAQAILPEMVQTKTVVITIPRPVPKKKAPFSFLDEEAVE